MRRAGVATASPTVVSQSSEWKFGKEDHGTGTYPSDRLEEDQTMSACASYSDPAASIRRRIARRLIPPFQWRHPLATDHVSGSIQTKVGRA